MEKILFRVLKELIKRNQIDDLEKKIDIFYANDKLNDAEYKELIELLKSLKN